MGCDADSLPGQVSAREQEGAAAGERWEGGNPAGERGGGQGLGGESGPGPGPGPFGAAAKNDMLDIRKSVMSDQLAKKEGRPEQKRSQLSLFRLNRLFGNRENMFGANYPRKGKERSRVVIGRAVGPSISVTTIFTSEASR